MVGQGELVSTPCQVNESWTLEDCTVVRCEGNNYIVLLEPQPVEKVACVNGHQPVKVQSPQDPCQYHYECECERRWAGGGPGAWPCWHLLDGQVGWQWAHRGTLPEVLSDLLCHCPQEGPQTGA